MKTVLQALILWMAVATSALAVPVRIKDLADFDGVRGNDLVGYGLVVGLDGTGFYLDAGQTSLAFGADVDLGKIAADTYEP